MKLRLIQNGKHVMVDRERLIRALSEYQAAKDGKEQIYWETIDALAATTETLLQVGAPEVVTDDGTIHAGDVVQVCPGHKYFACQLGTVASIGGGGELRVDLAVPGGAKILHHQFVPAEVRKVGHAQWLHAAVARKARC